MKLAGQSPREKRTVLRGSPTVEVCKESFLRFGLHMYKEDESYTISRENENQSHLYQGNHKKLRNGQH